MLITTAAHNLVNVLDQSDSSGAAAATSQDAPVNNADSELSSLPTITTTTPRKTRSTKRISWEGDHKEASPQRPRRSNRGVAPKRLGESNDAESLTSQRVAQKRTPATQPPQPPPKRVSAGRKPLSNAANTLGKTRGLNTAKVVAKQTPKRLKPPAKPATPKSRVQPSPPTRSTTTGPIIPKLKSKLSKTPLKAMGKQVIQKRAIVPAVSSLPPPVKYKLHFATRWEHQILSDDDTKVFDTHTSWIEVMKLMDEPIHKYCRSNHIYNQIPYKIKAIITSARASRGSKENSTITLEHARAEPWCQVMDLVRLNYSNGLKDISIVIDSIWTPAGLEPPELPPITTPIIEPEAASTSRTGKRTEKSIMSSSKYQEARGVFWNEIIAFWACPSPINCKVKARLGIACWVHKGRHYEITYNMAPKWREAILSEGGNVRHPPRSIRRLIKREDEKLEAEHAQQQAAKQKAKVMPIQASPSVSQVFNFGSQQPLQPPAFEVPQTPRQKSHSPIPQELDSGAGWVAFWESVKHAVAGTRPEAWQAGLDRAMAALDADFWTLAMLFKATDAALEKVVPQTGLRMLIHEHLSKFISSHKQHQLATSQESNLGGTAPRIYSSDRINVSSDDSSEIDDSSDDKDLDTDPETEHQTQTSDGMI
jgi:hypothetical protein